MEKNIEQSIKNQKEILLVAEEDNEIIGFCGGGLNHDLKTKKYKSDLAVIYILDQFHKKGIGTKLVLEFIKHIKEMDLNSMVIWVLEDNKSKIFYEKLGGSLIAEKMIEFSGKFLKGIAYGWDNLDRVIDRIIRNESRQYWDNEFKNSTFDYKKLASKESWNNFTKQIDDKNIKTVLDLGCGGGHWSIILTRKGLKVKAVDISSSAIKKLEKWSQEENLEIETEVCDLQSYTDNQKYDLIICNSVLDHLLLDDIKKALKLIYNLLNQNGYALISFDSLEEDNNENYDIIDNDIKLYNDEENYGMLWKYYSESEIRFLCKDFNIHKFTGSNDKRKYIWLNKN